MDKQLPIIEDDGARRAFAMHARTWQSNRYVYPVVSRRSKGISIGVNLNPDKVCNFDCIYCSVDRTGGIEPEKHEVDLAVLRAELAGMLQRVTSGEIYQFDPFDRIPSHLRRLNDIAFSGDGEPTTYEYFMDACRLAAEIREANPLADVKLIVITNATMFHRPAVREVLAFLDQHNGEIWAKLDAGTKEYYDIVERTAVPFERVLENLLWCAQTRPTVIQSLFMKVHDVPPGEAEVEAYAERLATILQQGGVIKGVQIYTVARQTTESYATALSAVELETIASTVRGRCPGLPTEIFP